VVTPVVTSSGSSGKVSATSSTSSNRPSETSGSAKLSAEPSSNKGGIIAGVVIGVGVVIALGLMIAVKYWKPSGKLKERFESSRAF
jgi:hypothetical protein